MVTRRAVVCPNSPGAGAFATVGNARAREVFGCHQAERRKWCKAPTQDRTRPFLSGVWRTGARPLTQGSAMRGEGQRCGTKPTWKRSMPEGSARPWVGAATLDRSGLSRKNLPRCRGLERRRSARPRGGRARPGGAARLVPGKKRENPTVRCGLEAVNRYLKSGGEYYRCRLMMPVAIMYPKPAPMAMSPLKPLNSCI